MPTPYALAFLAVLTYSLNRCIYRQTMKSGGDSFAILILVCCFSTLVLPLIFPLPAPGKIGVSSGLLLLANGLIWLLADLFAMRACKYISAGLSEIYNTFTYILTVFAALLVFREHLSGLQLVGVLLVVIGVLSVIGAKGTGTSHFRGTFLKLVSVVLTASAISLDKYLVSKVSPELVAFSNFLVPALGYLVCGYGSIKLIPETIKTSSYWLVLSPFMAMACYWSLLTALARGQLSTVTTIYQSTVIVVLLLEVLIFRLRENLAKLFLAALAAFCGIAAVCLG